MSFDNTPPRMPKRRHRDNDPKMIGLWKIGRTIGKGSSGRVRMARHSKTGQLAAVKIVSKNPMLNSSVDIETTEAEASRVLLGIEREIVIMKLISHPNIMRLYDVWETSTELYLILEYVEGGELFDYLCSKGRLSDHEALFFFHQIIGAVDYCHRFNIAHRDLKPENLLLDKNRNIKLADFGMATWQWSGRGNLLRTSCGSPHYAAPEIIAGREYDGARTDVWSCGVVLFALLAGKLPFDDEDLITVLEKVKRGSFDMPSDINPQAQDLIRRMLQKDVEKRITIAEIYEHPYFLIVPSKTTAFAKPDLDVISRPIPSDTEIDPDIFSNLRTLWDGIPDEDIIKHLRSDSQTWHKGVYNLLLQYREQHLPEYEASFEEETTRRSSKQRTPTFLEPEPNASQLSAMMYPPRCINPAPQNITESSPALPQIVFSRNPSSVMEGNTCAQSTPARTGQHASRQPDQPLKPILDQSQPSFGQLPGHTNDNIDRLLEEMANVTVVTGDTKALLGPSSPLPLRHRIIKQGTPTRTKPSSNGPPSELRTTPNVGASPEVMRVSRRETDKKSAPKRSFVGAKGLNVKRVRKVSPLHLFSKNKNKENLPVVTVLGGGVVDKSVLQNLHSSESGPSSSGVKQRHIQIQEPNVKPSKKASPSRASQHTSTSSVSPNSMSTASSVSTSGSGKVIEHRSWFTNIFKFNPDAYELLSMQDPIVTRAECIEILFSLGVQVDRSGDGSGIVRCHLNELSDPAGVMGVVKAVKFWLELHLTNATQTAAGQQVLVRVIYDKGSFASFRTIYGMLRRAWTFDRPLPATAAEAAANEGRRNAFESHDACHADRLIEGLPAA